VGDNVMTTNSPAIRALRASINKRDTEIERLREALAASEEREAGLTAEVAERDKPCEWLHYDHCEGKGKSDRAWHWKTSCGEVWVRSFGGPAYRGYKFCPLCGRPVVEVSE